MLHEKGLSKKYWVETANTSISLLNRPPSKEVDGKTLFKARYGYKPFLKNFKVFEWLCFTVKRDKLDKKVEPRIFVRYNFISKAYRICQPSRRKILISRDVYFMENEQ